MKIPKARRAWMNVLPTLKIPMQTTTHRKKNTNHSRWIKKNIPQ